MRLDLVPDLLHLLLLVLDRVGRGIDRDRKDQGRYDQQPQQPPKPVSFTHMQDIQPPCVPSYLTFPCLVPFPLRIRLRGNHAKYHIIWGVPAWREGHPLGARKTRVVSVALPG